MFYYILYIRTPSDAAQSPQQPHGLRQEGPYSALNGDGEGRDFLLSRHVGVHQSSRSGCHTTTGMGRVITPLKQYAHTKPSFKRVGDA